MNEDVEKLNASLRKAGRELDKLDAQHETHLKAIKGRFNLFTVLLGIGDETRLHSRWLAYLLNPKREHDCASLFLDLFLRTLKQTPPQSHSGEPMDSSWLDTFDCDNAKVSTEVRTDEGRLDFRIECPSWGPIVIENKIWATEQPDQIKRYAEHLGNSDGRRLLLYLTLYGKQSQTAGEEFTGNYYRISYREHILEWLEDCLRATYEHVNINQALQQYKGVVSHLIGNTQDAMYMEEIAQLLKDHPAIIKHQDEIKNGIERLKLNYWKDFISELRKQLVALNIEMKSQEDSGKDWKGFWFTEKHSVKMNAENGLRFLIQWHISVSILKLGALPLDFKTVAQVWEVNRSQFEAIGGRLKADFTDCFLAPPTNWWPLGQYQLISGFMNYAFLAENACDYSPAALHEKARPIADMIHRFLILAKQYIGEQMK